MEALSGRSKHLGCGLQRSGCALHAHVGGSWMVWHSPPAPRKCSPSMVAMGSSQLLHALPRMVEEVGRHGAIVSPRSSSLPRGRWIGAGSARQLRAARDGGHRQEVDWIRPRWRSRRPPGRGAVDPTTTAQKVVDARGRGTVVAWGRAARRRPGEGRPLSPGSDCRRSEEEEEGKEREEDGSPPVLLWPSGAVA